MAKKVMDLWTAETWNIRQNQLIVNSDESKSLMVFEIQRMSTEDGPGIRTTVFVKGCNLACIWCQNPESISPLPQLIWIGVKCIV
ncbi:MAG: Benzylsuccinate synthase activating enzyme [Syntrophomonadaceae bacterium]|nr:Benzylsuccinate synthase activating enzyme [Bacillota bacterium]